jgi:hypothetical protein
VGYCCRNAERDALGEHAEVRLRRVEHKRRHATTFATTTGFEKS